MRKAAVMMSILIASLFAASLLAHEGHEHKVMGTVAAVDASHLELTTPEGDKVDILLSKDTKFFKGKETATADDLKPGVRVAVTFEEKEGQKTAHEVRVSAAAK